MKLHLVGFNSFAVNYRQGPGTQWRYYGAPAVAGASVTRRVSYHTFGPLLNPNGENAKGVPELLRHAAMKVTTDIDMQAVSPQKRAAQSKPVRMVFKKAASQA